MNLHAGLAGKGEDDTALQGLTPLVTVPDTKRFMHEGDV